MYNMSGLLVYSNVVLKQLTFFFAYAYSIVRIVKMDKIKLNASLINFDEAVGHFS